MVFQSALAPKDERYNALLVLHAPRSRFNPLSPRRTRDTTRDYVAAAGEAFQSALAPKDERYTWAKLSSALT